jgi:hypothetical protein
MYLFRRLAAFIRGIAEGRSDLTQSYDDVELMECYDHGRSLRRGSRYN